MPDSGKQSRRRAVDGDGAEGGKDQRHDIRGLRVAESLDRLRPARDAGAKMTSVMALPSMARLASGHLRAMKTNTLTEVSSRKSTLSASSDTDPAANATVNSTKK